MRKTLALGAVFLAGLLVGILAAGTIGVSGNVGQPATITQLQSSVTQIPSAIAQSVSQGVAQANGEPVPRPSPAGRVNESQVHVYPDKVVLNVKNAEWSEFTNTHSMEPVISASSYAIQYVPQNASELKVGDIVSYASDYATGIFIHRIISIGNDSQGWYAIVKGDNNPSPDPGRIRFSQIKRVVIAIIY